MEVSRIAPTDRQPTVVSLLPSATEIVYALGCEPAAVSHECDHPEDALEKPTANRSFVDGGGSADINEQVERAEERGGVYELKVGVIESIAPDLILSQGVCDVCAVDDTLVREVLEDSPLDARVLSTHPHELEDVLSDIERIGAALDREERAREIVAELRERVAAVDGRTPGSGPTVGVIEWMEPVMVGGHWVPELIDLAGGESVLASAGERSRPVEWSRFRGADPDVIVVAPCGFSIDRTLSNAAELTDRDGWSELTAVRDGRVYAVDGHHYMNRPGPRLVDTLEHLAGLIHPDRFGVPPADVARPFPAGHP